MRLKPALSQALPDLIPYREGQKWGYCDSTGKVIIIPAYDAAHLFHGEFAIVMLGYKYGLINRKGDEVIKPQYKYMHREKNYYVVQPNEEKRYYINEKNERVDDFDDPIYQKIKTTLNRRYGRNVKNVVRLHKNYYQATYDTSYIALEQFGYHHYTKDVTESLYFLCNEKGDMLSVPSFGNIRMLCPEMYYVGYVGYEEDARILNAKGIVINKIKAMSTIECGVYRFNTDKGWYIVDSADCKLYTCANNILELGPYKNNYAHATLNTTGKSEQVLVDTKAKPFTKPHHYLGDYSEGLCLFQEQNVLCGYIDEKGNEIIPATYTRAYDFKEGLALVEVKGDFYYIDKTGKKVLEVPFKYERSIQKSDRAGRMNISDRDFYGFSNGLALFEKEGKYGYINKEGKEVLPAEYAYAEPFLNGVAIIYLPSDSIKGLFTHYAIDAQGKKLHHFGYLYDAQTITQYAMGFNQSATMKTKKWRAFYDQNNWTLFDNTGKKITGHKINSVYNENISDGRLIKVYLTGTNNVGYISVEGKFFFKD